MSGFEILAPSVGSQSGEGQTPWASNIDGAGHSLLNTGYVSIRGTGGAPSTGKGLDFFYSAGGGISLWDAATSNYPEGESLDIDASAIKLNMNSDGLVEIGLGGLSSNGNIDCYGQFRLNGTTPLMADPTTTKGDMAVHAASGNISRLPAGSNGQVLIADSAQALGVKWTALKTRIGHTWALLGDLTLLTVLPSIFIPIVSPQTAAVIELRMKIASGTSITVQPKKNGSNLGSTIVVTPTATTTAVSSTLANNDELTLLLSSPVGTPTTLSATLIVEHSYA